MKETILYTAFFRFACEIISEILTLANKLALNIAHRLTNCTLPFCLNSSFYGLCSLNSDTCSTEMHGKDYIFHKPTPVTVKTSLKTKCSSPLVFLALKITYFRRELNYKDQRWLWESDNSLPEYERISPFDSSVNSVLCKDVFTVC